MDYIRVRANIRFRIRIRFRVRVWITFRIRIWFSVRVWIRFKIRVRVRFRVRFRAWFSVSFGYRVRLSPHSIQAGPCPLSPRAASSPAAPLCPLPVPTVPWRRRGLGAQPPIEEGSAGAALGGAPGVRPGPPPPSALGVMEKAPPEPRERVPGKGHVGPAAPAPPPALAIGSGCPAGVTACTKTRTWGSGKWGKLGQNDPS